ncbi:MAG: ATP cone domain-containing protein [Omnitrophica WOR_2 bacterium]
MAKIQNVIKRSGAVVPFLPERITNAIYRAAVAVGGRDRNTAEELSRQVVKLLEEKTPEPYTPTIEEIQDLVEKVLIENGHAKVAKAYILYRDERARARKERAALASKPSENIPWAKIWHILDWAVDHHVNTVSGLNERINRGEFPLIIQESEAAYNEDVENAVEVISSRAAQLKMVIITGPSSSGKTTTTIKIGQRLNRLKLKLITLNVDNYFYDLELHPKDEFGDYDFETPQALDLALINQHLNQLISGKEVQIPFYDFKTGHRTNDRTPLKLGKNEVLLIDSLHGLYPEMTSDIYDEQKFKIYLEPLLQMKGPDGKYVRWADLRLIRRMLRDASHRAYDPRRTLEHWHYVRSSEMRNIIPYINGTDYIINSGMPYELCIYRARLLDEFATWMNQDHADPLRTDAYKRAARIFGLLSHVLPVADDSNIPADSVIREFIGGSSYHYT